MNDKKFALILIIVILCMLTVAFTIALHPKQKAGNLVIKGKSIGYDSNGRYYSKYYLIWNGDETVLTINNAPYETRTKEVYNGMSFQITVTEPYPCVITWDGNELRLLP